MKLWILVSLFVSACAAPTLPVCPEQPKRTMGINLPVPVHQARVCWPWKDGGFICEALDSPKADTFIITGTAK